MIIEILKYSSKKILNQKSDLFSNNLKDLHIGDDIEIRHLNTIESYRIIDIQIISLEEAITPRVEKNIACLSRGIT